MDMTDKTLGLHLSDAIEKINALPESQRPALYSMQSFFIGVGAVVASMLPWILAYFGVNNQGTAGSAVPDTVRLFLRDRRRRVHRRHPLDHR